MLEMFPYIPVAQGVRISIGIMSYDGHVAIGVTGDYDAVPDLDVLCTAIEDVARRAGGHRHEPVRASGPSPATRRYSASRRWTRGITSVA